MRKELQTILQQARDFSSKNIMFIMARNTNKNIVCFEGDDTNGCKEPYWIMNEHSPVDMEPLTHLEKKFGFGLKDTKNHWEKYLVPLKEKPITFKYEDNTWKAYTIIDGEMDELESVYIRNRKTLGVFPKVESIHIYGKKNKEKIVKD